MGEQQPEKSDSVPIYEELASELCDPAEEAWHFPPTPAFVHELVADRDEEDEAAAAVS
ncbi:hypothetical protein [Saccharopolyspora griseoalba]|uniref:Uncharacterized protein n=1 Tax=Saccharopolyspora griseoalba TaxID=1431848 RepID=A0ABW2LL94_9PSEU